MCCINTHFTGNPLAFIKYYSCSLSYAIRLKYCTSSVNWYKVYEFCYRFSAYMEPSNVLIRKIINKFCNFQGCQIGYEGV